MLIGIINQSYMPNLEERIQLSLFCFFLWGQKTCTFSSPQSKMDLLWNIQVFDLKEFFLCLRSSLQNSCDLWVRIFKDFRKYKYSLKYTKSPLYKHLMFLSRKNRIDRRLILPTSLFQDDVSLSNVELAGQLLFACSVICTFLL